MASTKLSIVNLITPQYLAGIQLPLELQDYLAIIGVDEIETFYTENEVVYSGKASLGVDHLGSNTNMSSSSGSNFSWDTPSIHFRMVVPRNGAEFIDTAANDFDASNPSSAGKLPNVSSLLNDLKPLPDADMDETEVITDFPAVGFRLELLLDILNFTLGDDWKPGVIDPVDNRVRIDPERSSDRVKIRLPKVVLSYSQGDLANDLNPKFEIESWGVAGFDAPQDLNMGELIRMDPAIAVYANELIAFSVDQVILDFSEEATPLEVLQHFGVDESWKGVYIGQALLYFNNDQGVGFNFRVNDALISFDGEVSLEAALDIYLNSTIGILTANPTFYNGATPVRDIRRGIITPPISTRPSGNPSGRVELKPEAVMHLQIHGGMPPYTTQVLDSDGTDIWDSSSRRAVFNSVGNQKIFILVTDSSTGAGSPLRSSEYIQVVVKADEESAPEDGLPEDRPPSDIVLQPLEDFAITGQSEDRRINLRSSGNTVNLEVIGTGDFTVMLTGVRAGSPVSQTFSNQRNVVIPAPNDTNITVSVEFADQSLGPIPVQSLNFQFDKPKTPEEVLEYIRSVDFTTNTSNSSDGGFSSSVRTLLSNGLPGSDQVSAISLIGYASQDQASNAYDIRLSNRRNEVAASILSVIYPGISPAITSNGHTLPLPNSSDLTSQENRTVKITLTTIAIPAQEISALINRPEAPEIPETPAVETPAELPPNAPEDPRDIPNILKQLGIRIKLERNELSLLELYGKIDLETELEEKIHSESGADADARLRDGTPNPEDGVVDFKLGYQYNRATQETSLSFLLKSDERDLDGIIPPLENNATNDNRLLNIFGALLLFAPIINSSATAVGEDNEDGAAWIGLGVSLAVPIAIGGLNVFRTRRVILHGGEARTRWVNPAPGEPLRSLDLGIVFDYEVQFDIICEQLGIGLDRIPGSSAELPPPLRARYKAIGFNLNYTDTPAYKGLTYSPVFDASKGYDLDLSDPSLFSLPEPLGSLFNIAGARLARFNPVTLEIDFAIKVDLGIITVDKFKLKIPLDPTGPPQIIPSGVRVNIPGVLVGNGFVEILDTEIIQPDGTSITSKGIEGGLDLTLVSLKIRIAANIGLGTIIDPVSKREAVSVFIGLRVEFPTPIILGATGLGIYGFMGLFAMHYKRLEADADPTKAVGPALNWLIKASGDPTRLRTESASQTGMAPAGPKLWEMAFDRWSFGIGVLMGTAEGGFLVNMQGMLVLELPGPRILIMVKVKIVSLLPSNPAKPATELQMGIIGIVDIDFGRKQLTLGVMINFSIEEIIELSLPIELFFKWDDPRNWHLYLGTIAQPCSATILDIVRGSAYLMLQANQLVYADYGSKVPEFFQDKVLNGIAIAIGLEASIIFGNESKGIYLKIAAGAHLGVSFAPFLLVGNMYFTGHLRLLIVSISARGEFNVLVSKLPNSDGLKTYIEGEVCGSISFFFFEISACIGLKIGNEEYDVEPPKLIRGVYLQSFSPVLVSGQGSSKPIDASLGAAFDLADGTIPADLLRVPIDSLPVIQFHASPKIGEEFVTDSFIANPGTISATGGKIQLSDEVEVEYILEKVTLLESGVPYSSSTETKPPAVWRLDRPNNSSPTDTAVDLATFSRTPATAPHAVERSSELLKNVEVRWQNACKQAAPPASVLYTFCDQPLGISQAGWTLSGTPKPDPEDTIRVKPVHNTLKVYQEGNTAASLDEMLLDALGFESTNPAQIIGIDQLQSPSSTTKEKKCVKTPLPKINRTSTSFTFEKELKVTISKNLIKPTFSHFNILKNTSDFKIIKPTAGTSIKPNVILNSPFKFERISIIKDVVIRPIDPVILPPKIGVPLNQTLRIDFIQAPVETALIKFSINADKNIKSRSLKFTAFSAKGEVITEQIYKPRTAKSSNDAVTLNGNEIAFVTLTSQNFSGELLEVCFTRIKVSKQHPIEQDTRCLRALQFPWFSHQDWEKKEIYAKSFFRNEQELNLNFPNDSGMVFETGACSEVILFGAIHLKNTSDIVIQELDKEENILFEYAFDSLSIQTISNTLTDLPADWLSTSLPWRPSILHVATFLYMDQFKPCKKFTVKFAPQSEGMAKLQIKVLGRPTGFPALYLSAMEILQLSEVIHHSDLTVRQETEQTTLTGYLNDDTPIPLLKPNTHYNMRVDYTAIVRTRKNVTDSFEEKKRTSENQSFAFATDLTPPLPLSPYVLGTTPEMDTQFHFFQDAVKVVFNDNAFLRMYERYGKQLKIIIRGADGKPVFNSPEIISTLEDITAGVTNPYREAVEWLIEQGFLPCTGRVNFPNNSVFTPAFELKPLMPYTMDIEFDPEDFTPDDQSKTPLFRRSFKTSKYANLEGLVNDFQGAKVNHKALQSVPSGLPIPSSSTGECYLIEDSELEQLLNLAGVRPGNSQEHFNLTLLWTVTGSSGDFIPYALLIDSAEPLWKTTSIAKSKTVKNEQNNIIDPNFKIYENEQIDSMRLKAESSGSRISHFVRTSSGMRTLVILRNTSIAPSGEDLMLMIQQPELAFFDIPEKLLELCRITLFPDAPWEEN